MRKIPTVFVRDPATKLRYVLDEVQPECKWVLEGEGVATRKYDGTCVMLDGHGVWWARREVKAGKEAPPGFVPVEYDDVTGKTVGWEPADQSGFARWLADAVTGTEATGTYELCGPKINGNPEHYPEHRLMRHDAAEIIDLPATLDFRTCECAIRDLGEWEGVVWHHPDGRMAKLKRRDFPKPADE